MPILLLKFRNVKGIPAFEIFFIRNLIIDENTKPLEEISKGFVFGFVNG